MRSLPIKKIIFLVVIPSIVVYLVYLNAIVIPSHVVTSMGVDAFGGCSPSNAVLSTSMFIYGNTSLDHGVLCYRIRIVQYWESDPINALTVGTYVVSRGTPWYVRGYSIEVSDIDVNIDGLPMNVLAEPIPIERVTEDRTSKLFDIWVAISNNIVETYHAELHVSMKLRVTEWSILGPIKTYEIPILNKTIPITIEIKKVYPETYRWLVQQAGQ